MIPLLDLDAPIVSGVGLAGLALGARLSTYRQLLNAAHHQYGDSTEADEPNWCDFWMVPWAIRYRVGQVYDVTEEEFDAFDEAARRGELDEALRHVTPSQHDFDPVVEIYADVRLGRVFKLSALLGYNGALGSLKPGMRVAEAMAADPRLHYDEGPAELRLGDDEGVGFELSEADPEPEGVAELAIDAIEVYELHLTSRGGLTF